MNPLFTYALEHAQTRIQRVLSRKLDPCPDIALKQANGDDIRRFQSHQLSGRVAFNWSSRYDQVDTNRDRDLLVAIYGDEDISALADYRYDSDGDVVHFIQVESSPELNPLKGQITFTGLQIGLSLAQIHEASHLHLIGPFYSERQVQQYHALGFAPTEDGNMIRRIFPGMTSFNYDTCQKNFAPHTLDMTG